MTWALCSCGRAEVELGCDLCAYCRDDHERRQEQDDALRADSDRLVAIAERVLAGDPIEDFELGEYEIHVVVGYCQRAHGLE